VGHEHLANPSRPTHVNVMFSLSQVSTTELVTGSVELMRLVR